ncbi:potassium channel family protein [Natronocella acetinitrilica]|uniref:potassium channel family protein n=1 Tax=Natronocella acetinitrilica TaxID=414046 RepID=UPI0020A04745|nr:potassium channel family protein [Natronocella acetinitrilica]
MRLLFLGLRSASRDRYVRGLLALAFTIIGLAALFYAIVEDWPYLDALYFSVMTIATVGYGDLAPVTTIGRLFTIAYVLVGLGIFIAAASALAAAILSQSDVEPQDQDRE